jgi:hypothetical protein
MSALNERAVEAASNALCKHYEFALEDFGSDWKTDVEIAVDAYFASLAEQGERMVSVREVEALIEQAQIANDAFRLYNRGGDWQTTDAAFARLEKAIDAARNALIRFAPTEAER